MRAKKLVKDIKPFVLIIHYRKNGVWDMAMTSWEDCDRRVEELKKEGVTELSVPLRDKYLEEHPF